MNYTLHVLAGALIASTPVPIEYAAGAVLLAAVGKEIYDRRQGAKFDGRDVLATVAGGMPVLTLKVEW